MSKQVCQSHGEERRRGCERCGDFYCVVCSGLNTECPPCVDHAMSRARGGKHVIAIASVLYASLLCTLTIEAGVWAYHLNRHEHYLIPGMALGLNLLLLPYNYFIACFVVNTCHRAHGQILWEQRESQQAFFALPAISNCGLLFVCFVFNFLASLGDWSDVAPLVLLILGSATAVQLLTVYFSRKLLRKLVDIR